MAHGGAQWRLPLARVPLILAAMADSALWPAVRGGGAQGPMDRIAIADRGQVRTLEVVRQIPDPAAPRKTPAVLACPRCGERTLLQLDTTRYSTIFYCGSCDGVTLERRP